VSDSMSSPHHTAFILAGATATGKSAAAQLLAEQMGCSILSADAMLVYQGMDIGTAKPTPHERGEVPYAGIDLVTPAEPFSTGHWLKAAARAFQSVGAPPPIVVGGTGLYIKALTHGIRGSEPPPELRAKWRAVLDQEGVAGLQAALSQRDPEAFNALADTTNPRRLLRALEQLETDGRLPKHWGAPRVPAAPIIVLTLPREQLHRRIERRVDQMFSAGLLEEVQALRAAYPSWSSTAAKAIGYEEACALLDNTLSHEEARARIIIRTRQLAKRQETWFRHQAAAHWLMINEHDAPQTVAQRVLDLWRSHGPTRIHIPEA
jgi:tRNA dimethylallyltransferase